MAPHEVCIYMEFYGCLEINNSAGLKLIIGWDMICLE